MFVVGEVNSEALRKAWKARVKAVHTASWSSLPRSGDCCKCGWSADNSEADRGSCTLPQVPWCPLMPLHR